MDSSVLAQNTGDGLQGEYTSGPITTKRVDGVVDFNWGKQAPMPTIPADNFLVKWTGQIEAPKTSTYWFAVQADDGLRVWIDGKSLINTTHGSYPSWFVSTGVSLVAGRKYDIRLEYTEKTGNAVVRLLWKTPGQAYSVVPRVHLYSTSTLPRPTTPSAPVNITAVGRWSDNCCDNQPMAHVALSWSPPPSSPVAIRDFNIYRDGALIRSRVTNTKWEDMGVTSGQTYSYQISSVSGEGRESVRSEIAIATAPFPPTGHGQTAPTNLRVQGMWAAAEKRATDLLAWDAIPGAVRYNIYQYDTLIGHSTGTTFTVPATKYCYDMTYTVTAQNASGQETLPSAMVSAQGRQNPAFVPNWMVGPPSSPTAPKAATEWNAGQPRVRLTWLGSHNAFTFDIYRDGKKVAQGIWGQVWLDNDVRPGERHTYSVASVNVPWTTPVESISSVPVTTTVPAEAPVVDAAARVVVKQVIPNDDSVLLRFDAVPGAADYRAYDVSKPGTYKYSGGSLSIEMNGLTPGVPAKLVVEAVDKFGPYQKMDGMLGPGATTHEGHASMIINGQGDPSNLPVVLAASVPTTVSCEPRILNGSQVFLDTFRDSQPFRTAPIPPALFAANPNEVAAIENDRWVIYNVRGDLSTSRAFVMGNHFMDTLYDGGTPHTNGPLHIAKSSLVMKAKPVADISNDKVLHVTFEVDAHFSGRRWCDVIIADANDTLTNPGAFLDSNQLPSVMGQIFRWEITKNVHSAQVVRGKDAKDNLVVVKLFDQDHGVGPDSFGPPSRTVSAWSDLPAFNGTSQDLDKRHRFDLYLSKNRFLVMEEGKIIKDKVFPNGVTLPFNRAAVYFVHQVYHTALERNEAQTNMDTDAYWMNHRPFADERHWDNMGFEVLNAFPVGRDSMVIRGLPTD